MSDRNYNFFQSQISGKVNEIYDYSPYINGVGDLTRLSGINVLINSLKNLLLTPLGSYPFDPEYGSLLYNQLFEPSDSITEESIKYEVSGRIALYDPRIKIDSVNLTWSKDRKTASVNVSIDRNGVKGKLSASLTQQQFMFGAEDEITANSDISSGGSSSYNTDATKIKQIYNNSETEDVFIINVQTKYPLMPMSMIEGYWNMYNKDEMKP